MIAPVTNHTSASSTSHLSDLISPLMDDSSESAALHFSPSTIVPVSSLTERTTKATTTSNPADSLYTDATSTGYFDPMIHQVTTSASSTLTDESVTHDASTRISSTNEAQSVTLNDNNNMRSPQQVSHMKSVKSSSSSINVASGIISTAPPSTTLSIELPHKASDLREIQSTGNNLISPVEKDKNFQSDPRHHDNWTGFSFKSWESKRNKMTSSSPSAGRFNKIRERNLPFLKPQLKEQLNLHSSETKRKPNRISYASNIKTRKSGSMSSNSASGSYSRIINTKLPHVSGLYLFCSLSLFFYLFSSTHSTARQG